jgi:uncharacterized protein YegJ (DUF2314 family)
VRRIALLAVCLLAALVGASCGGGDEAAETNVVALAEDDPKIAAAKEEAQRRWPEFEASVRAATPGAEHAVKVAFPTEDGSREHLWVQVTAIDGESVRGTIDNEPIADIGHEYGDPVTVQRAEVEDWIVRENGEIAKGYFSEEAVESGDE